MIKVVLVLLPNDFARFVSNGCGPPKHTTKQTVELNFRPTLCDRRLI